MSGKKISEDLNNEMILKIFTKIIILIGVKEISMVEKSVLLDYVRKYLGHFTPQEILIAFEMAMQGRLSCDTKAYGVLSSQLVQDVMDAYKHYTYELRRQVDMKPQEDEDKPMTKYDIDELFATGIRELFEKYKKDKKVWDGNWTGKHDWLVGKGVIPAKTHDPEERKALEAEARLMWMDSTERKLIASRTASDIKRLKNLLQMLRDNDPKAGFDQVLPTFAKEIKVKRYFDKLISEGK